MIEKDVIYGKKISEWDTENWIDLGQLDIKNISGLKGIVGLYKIKFGNNREYYGKATEIANSKGLYKRLNDYIRVGDSGRKSKIAQDIHANLDSARVEVLKVGKGIEAKFATNYLESYFMNKFKPNGNSHS